MSIELARRLHEAARAHGVKTVLAEDVTELDADDNITAHFDWLLMVDGKWYQSPHGERIRRPWIDGDVSSNVNILSQNYGHTELRQPASRRVDSAPMLCPHGFTKHRGCPHGCTTHDCIHWTCDGTGIVTRALDQQIGDACECTKPKERGE